MTIDNIFQQYFELKKVKWSQHTLHSNLSSYNNHIYPIIGERNIDTLNYIDYQKLANKLLDLGLAVRTHPIWPPRAFALGQLTHQHLATSRIDYLAS